MNPNSSHPAPPDPEARLTALLLGELAPDAAAALYAEVAADPALARLLARLARTLPHVREAIREPASAVAPPPDAPRLSTERRDALLATFKTLTPAFERAAPAPRRRTNWLAIAAAVAALLFLSAGLLLPALSKAKARAQQVTQLNRERMVRLERLSEAGQAAEPMAGANGRVESLGRLAVKVPSGAPDTLFRQGDVAGSERDGLAVDELRTADTAGRPNAGAGAADGVTGMDSRLVMRYGLWAKDTKADAGDKVLAEGRSAAVAEESTEGEGAVARRSAGRSRGLTDWFFAATNRGLSENATGVNRAYFGETQRDDFGIKDNESRADNFGSFAGGLAGGTSASGGGFGGGGGGFGGVPQAAARFGRDLDRLEAVAEREQVAAAPAPARPDRAEGSAVNQPLALGFELRDNWDQAPANQPSGGRGSAANESTRRRALSPSSGVVRNQVALSESTPVVVAAPDAGIRFSVPVEGMTVAAAVPSAPARSASTPASPAPTLGDLPQLGVLFDANDDKGGTALGVEARQAAGSSRTRGRPALAGEMELGKREELVPLPIQLPIPAFMGTPTDLPLGEVRSKPASPAAPAPPPPAAPASRGGLLAAGQYGNSAAESITRFDPANTDFASITPAGPATERFLYLAGEVGGAESAGKPVQRVPDQALREQLSQVLERQSGQGGATTESLELFAKGLQDRLQDQPAWADFNNDWAPVELKGKGVTQLAAGSPLQAETAPATRSLSLESKSAEGLAKKRLADLADGVQAEPAIEKFQAAPPPVPQAEVAAAENPFSTFSLNVADVSYRLAAASLEAGHLPDAAAIRVEDFINAFDYRDPEPAPGLPVAFAWERARHPFAHNRELLRFGVKTAAQGREAGRALNLVLLLDSSGSMERADRVAIIREALNVLAGQLQAADRISVVGFARTPRLWVDGLPGSQAAELPDRVGEFTPEGGTNLEDALKTGYETLTRHFQAGGVNRLILLTDGAANLGDVVPQSLRRMVETNRRRGLALDCFGIGWDGYNDDLLEVLSRNGDGRYGFVNTPEEVATDFAAQLTGALQVAASDVKVQVEFNPARVTNWRQIGYAKHQLTKEQFRDNTVDAAEIGAAEAGNALYAVEVNPQGQGPLGLVRVRYRVPATGQYHEHEWALDHTGNAPTLEAASPALRLAATAALLGERLSGSPFAGDANSDRLLALLDRVPEAFEPDPRPRKLEWMLRQAKSVSGQ